MRCRGHCVVTRCLISRVGSVLLAAFVLGGSVHPGLAEVAPDPVYNPVNGHWYQPVRVSSPLTWAEARGAAEALTFAGYRGHLATITSAEENQFIVRSVLPALGQYSDWWLGGYQDKTASDYREPAGGWRWVTGEPWSFTNWKWGEPNNVNGGENAFEIHNDGTWNDEREQIGHGGYIVEYDGGVPPGQTVPPQLPWPPIYNAANGHWYQEVEAPGGIAWQDANTAAQATSFQGLAGHLATITSGEENQFVLNNLAHAIQGNWWLGGYQGPSAAGAHEPAGGWRWVTGEPWSFTNWQAGQPDNSKGAEDRLHLVNNGRWNDVASSFALGGYVIEFDTPAEYGAPAVAMVEIIPAPVSGGHLATGQVTLTAPAGSGGIAVTLSSSNPDVASPVIDRIVILAGSVRATFKIHTCRCTAAAYLTISATANGITKSRELTVYP